VLIVALGPLSGAHFNPAVTAVAARSGEMRWGRAAAYMAAQIAGCLAGVILAHAMFGLPLLQAATTVRAGPALMLSEGVATFVLVFAILAVGRHRPDRVPAAVALVIAAGYWWTSSTSFANPAITVARAFSDTFAGVRLVDAPGFIVSQFAGAALALGVVRILFAEEENHDPLSDRHSSQSRMRDVAERR
ncbi:MAG: aquaporin, partial [Parvularculaceae bacterium]|nr:aquaporin [Parvularculaceae bacterium]